jgi:hypothetical protein
MMTRAAQLVKGVDFVSLDAAERRYVIRLVKAMMTQFADIGAMSCHDGNVALTGLGGALASAAAVMSGDDEDPD